MSLKVVADYFYYSPFSYCLPATIYHLYLNDLAPLKTSLASQHQRTDACDLDIVLILSSSISILLSANPVKCAGSHNTRAMSL